MASLVLCQHDGATLDPAVARLVRAAVQLGGEVDLLVAGSDGAAAANQAAQLDGVRNVLLANDPRCDHMRAEIMAALLLSVAADYRAFLGAATTTGKNIMPRLAALLDVAQVSEVTRILSGDTFEHPVYAGNAIETVRTTDPKAVLTVRTSAFEPAGASPTSAQIVAIELPEAPCSTTIIGRSQPSSDRPDLGAARVVVSGGRGFGSKEKFEELLLPLADRLGAAIGASRAAVDAGYAPNDWQVGQTGKIVAPDIYIAIGISGAIQHLAGMKDAKAVIAINKDADAAIFEAADFGLVGDLFEIIPQLTAQLERAGKP